MAPADRVVDLCPSDEQRSGTPVHAIVELPEPVQPPGYAERTPYKLTWEGGVHLLGAGILIIPGRTLSDPEVARQHAAAVLAAAARMEARR
ncbi:hypothetical protein [Pseudonocardia sp. NPDC049154]|uniref:hypothetical protein n=1 Tax=Pseudonocardia sp. NPDC049154 TaxID=3155501 RepID=UPI0033C1D7D4